ncbi:MAG: nitroreductase family protein [Clostridium sp.]|uniref:nitroreductase family protein n=1 Tax=Clostridium sp. TaxID=1506 RepID=UPI003EE7828D
MNELYNILINRHSIRNFKPDRITDDKIQKIVQAGQKAPTTGNSQAYSVILIEDEYLKKTIGENIQVQKFVYTAPIWLMVCIDWNRQSKLYKQLEINVSMNNESKLLVGSIDASLFTENMCIAAESMGIGSILIGSPWCNVNIVIKELRLPNEVMPLMLVCLGYPKIIPKKSTPRWPIETIIHRNKYREIKEDAIKEYYESGNKSLILQNYFDENIMSWKEHYSMRVGKIGNERTWKPLHDYIKSTWIKD